jgi:hypothetical protein
MEGYYIIIVGFGKNAKPIYLPKPKVDEVKK